MHRNKDLFILKHDKGKCAVSLHSTVDIDKCLLILNTQQFQQLDISSTAANENKTQHALRKLKLKVH